MNYGTGFLLSKSDLDDYKCGICRDIYEDPLKISCDHIFCEQCLKSLENQSSLYYPLRCPMCRKEFNLDDAVKAKKIDRILNECGAVCETCLKQVAVLAYRDHAITCPLVQAKRKERAEAKAQRKKDKEAGPSSGANKPAPTYKCPHCTLGNFDREMLLRHVSQFHETESFVQVVCPICASMPWGDKDQRSCNFATHIKQRHKFDYDEVVDFDLNDEEALEKAMMASLVLN